ncbi:MAG: hypothetical protein ACYC9S_09020 [Leptospirales bacterium]
MKYTAFSVIAKPIPVPYADRGSFLHAMARNFRVSSVTGAKKRRKNPGLDRNESSRFSIRMADIATRTDPKRRDMTLGRRNRRKGAEKRREITTQRIRTVFSPPLSWGGKQ